MQVKTPVQEIMVIRDFINNLSVHQSPVGAAPTNDSQTTTANTWSATKISNEITTAITNLINGADASSDTLKGLADKIAALAQADNGLVSTNQAQDFTEQQKAQARNNIDVYSKAEIGDINTNFVTTINTTYNG